MLSIRYRGDAYSVCTPQLPRCKVLMLSFVPFLGNKSKIMHLCCQDGIVETLTVL